MHKLDWARLAGFLLFSVQVAFALPVLPGIAGHGTDTPAGRGGIVYRVTNLNNSGPGSLRFGIEDASMRQPRVIVFEVAGVIELESDLIVRDDSFGQYGYLTIAGQTAPYPGITLKNFGISVRSHDVLVQHIAIRPGNLYGTQGQLDNRDCILVGAPPGVVTRNVVFDHVTCSWSLDEIASTWSDNGEVHDVTFINCVFADPIMNGEPDESGHSRIRSHSKGSHGYGTLAGRNSHNVSFIRNIYAFNTSRTPLVRDDINGAQVVNNFIYRPGAWPSSVIQFGDITLPPREVSVVGNVLIRHPTPFYYDLTRPEPDPEDPTKEVLITRLEEHPRFYSAGITINSSVHPEAVFYIADNRMYNPDADVWLLNEEIISDDEPKVIRIPSDPFDSGPAVVTPIPSEQVEDVLVASSGKFPATRDAIDAELIEKIQTRTGFFLQRLSELGADPWERVRSTVTRELTLPDDPNGDHNGDGYTNLEQWLHQMAAAVETTVNRSPVANAGEDRSVIGLPGQPSGEVQLDGRASYDADGDNLTYAWSWSGGSASGGTPTVTLPLGTTVITLTVDDGRGGTSTDTVSIEVLYQAPAVALHHLNQVYNGQPKPATVATNPEQLPYTITYNGQPTPPTLPGTYEVVATVTDPEYADTATGLLTIRPTALVRHAPVINGTIDGSVQVLEPGNLALNGSANISGDLLVPGTPSIRLNGSSSYDGTIDGPGASSPSNYQVILNGGAQISHLVRRVDPIAMPAVAAPPAPSGNRDVVLNQQNQDPGDFSTLRNLTLNGNAGIVAVPPGTYGRFIANNGAGFRIGQPGATEPATYNLQGLTLNGGAQLQVAGPVVLTIANGLTLNGSAGAFGKPEWFTVRVASGNAVLNSSVSFSGAILAPSGTVTLNNGSQIEGHVAADRLVINGGAAIRDIADDVPPQVTIVAPPDGAALSGTIAIVAQPTDDKGVAAVQFLLNGDNLGTEDAIPPYSIGWDTTNALVGAHVLGATVRDTSGNTASAEPLLVEVLDQAAPTVTITSPANGASVSGTVTVTADAQDNVGVSSVTLLLDGNPIGSEVTAPPYSIDWDTTTGANGTHILTAVARDAAGNMTVSAPRSVLVLNSSGTRLVYEENFDDGEAQDWSGLIGTWEVTNGQYAQTGNHYPDIAVYDGDTWETDVVFSASLRTSWSATNNRVGMLYNYVDAGNYAYVIFNAGGLAEMNVVTNGGSPVVVASAPYTGGGSRVWFDVAVIRSGTGTTVLVNDEVIFDNIPQPDLGAGKVGFITRFNGSALFDNVSVSVLDAAPILDSFESGTADGWTSDGAGTWAVESDGVGHVYRQSDATVVANRSVRSGSEAADQIIEADVKLNATSGNNRFFGIVARYQNPDDYYYFILRTNNTLELKMLTDGRSVNLAPTVPFTVTPGTWYRLRLETAGNTLRAYIDGELLMQATDTTYTSGSAALLTFYSDVSFDNVSITPL